MKESEIELSENVKQKLSEAVELWADENLISKPELLAFIMFNSLKFEMIKKIKEIKKAFPEKLCTVK